MNKKSLADRKKEFLQYIIDHPKCTQKDLREAFNAHRSRVLAALLQLQESDVISETVNGVKRYSARMEKHGVRQPDIMQYLFAHRWKNDVSTKNMHVMR